jgi:hypothetical protein
MPFQVGSQDSPKLAERYINLLGGINSNDKPWDIADFQLQWAENIQYRSGIIQRRFGTTAYTNPMSVDAHRLDWMSGNTYIALGSDNELYSNAGGNTWATVSAGVTTTNIGQLGIERFNGYLVYPSLYNAGGTTRPLLVDASDGSIGQISAGNWDEPRNFRWARKYKSWLFLGGASQEPAKVFHSNVDDLTLWTALEHYSLDPNDGGQVGNAVVVNDKFYLFKNTSVWRIFGDNPNVWVQKHVTNEFGVSIGAETTMDGSATTLQEFNEGCIFVNKDGRIIFFDGGEFIDVGKPIQNIVEQWISDGGGDSSNIRFSSMVWQKKYYLTCEYAEKDTTGEAQVLIFNADAQTPVWTQHVYAGVGQTTNGPLNCVAHDSVNNTPFMVGTDKQTYKIEQQDIYQDDGNDIRMQFTTKDFDLQSLEGAKRFKNVRIFRGNFKAPLYVHPRVDSVEVEDTMLPPSQDVFRSDRIPLRGRGRFLGFRFDSTGGKASEFHGFTPIWKPKKVR